MDDAQGHLDRYIKYVTPKIGDPTYSVLKAHLLFEELLWTYLERQLANPSALKDARFSFSQLASVARACSPIPADHWCWTALAKLNRVRNLLAHESRPDQLSSKIDDYVQFVLANNGVPLPEPGGKIKGAKSAMPTFLPVDMVTVALYYWIAGLLGFDVVAALAKTPATAGEVEG